MPLFRRHRDDGGDGSASAPTTGVHSGGGDSAVPGIAGWATSQGWQPVTDDKPFAGHLEDQVHEATLALYGVRRGLRIASEAVGPTTFADAYRGAVDGRTVTIANGFTYSNVGRFTGMTCH